MALLQRRGRADALSALLHLRAVRSQALVGRRMGVKEMQAWDMLLWVVVAMEVLTVCLLLIGGVAVVGLISRWRQSTH